MTWPALNEWMADTLEAMRSLFGPIVKTLNARDWVAEEAESLARVDTGIDGVT